MKLDSKINDPPENNEPENHEVRDNEELKLDPNLEEPEEESSFQQENSLYQRFGAAKYRKCEHLEREHK